MAGGRGTRLYPTTRATSKQLLPIYNKPMVQYPLTTLMLGGIREVMIISTPQDLPAYERLFGSGSRWGLKIAYGEQEKPEGIPQAFTVASDFLDGDAATLILGDNVFFGQGLGNIIRSAIRKNSGATVFGYHVKDPHRYGVAEFDAAGKLIGLEEKPAQPKSQWAIAGLYIYDAKVTRLVRGLTKSARGELEITDLNRQYLAKGELNLVRLGRGIAWLDTGTHDSLLEASSFIAAIEHRQGLRVACLEEVAYRMGMITSDQLQELARTASDEGLGSYLRDVLLESEAEGGWIG